MTLRTQPHKQITLLLVEDNPGDQRLIQERLREIERPHFSTIVVESLREALDHAAVGNVDAVLLDLDLPDSRGLDTLTELRRHAPHLPNIVLTGLADEEAGLSAIQHGADDYLTKDQIDAEMLRRAVVYAIERHRTHRAYQEMTEVHRLTLENISDAVFITDDDGRFTYVCPNTHHIFGYSDDEVREMGTIDRLLGREIVEDYPLNEQREIANIEHQVTDREGIRHDLLINIKRVDIYGGTVLYTCRDVTERVEAERELEVGRQRLQAIFDNALDAIVLTDDEARYVNANPAACELVGYPHDKLIGKSLAETLPESERERFGDILAEFWQYEQHQGDIQITRADGSARDIEYRTAGNIAPGLHLTIMRDITRRKSIERELVESQRFTESILDSLDANIAVLDEKGWIISTNAQWDQFSHDNGEPDLSRTGVGVNYLNVCRDAQGDGAEEAPHALAGIQAVLAGEEASFDLEYPCPGPDADDRWFMLHVSPFTGSQPGVVVAHLDITDRKRAEAELLKHVERLTTVNRLEWELTAQAAPEQIHERTASAITDLIPDIANVFIARFDAESELIHCDYAIHDGETLDTREFRPIPLEPEGSGLQSRVIHSGQPLIVNDFREALKRVRSVHEGDREGPLVRSALMAPMVSKGKVVGVLQTQSYTPYRFTEADRELLSLIANTTAVSLDNLQLLSDLQRANEELRDAYDATIAGWGKALELKDKETEGHTQRVVERTVQLAREFDLPEEEIEQIHRGALLHDIGKMGVPDHILHKPGELNGDEWEIIQQHPGYAYELLKSIDFLKPALAIPHCHHERWDGAGYPHGLSGENIPLEARIFAVIDAYDAMTNDRPYRSALSRDEAVRRLRADAGTQFDPDVVEAFVRMMRDDA